jgi:hypothetical protein
MPFLDAVANAIKPGDVALTSDERRVVLEIAYLAVASDHEIHESEVAALRAIAGKLGGGGEVDPLLDRLGTGLHREAADARLQELAKALATPAARALAYKAAYALSRADRQASDGEFEFDLQLIDALGLAQSEVDVLAGEVDQEIDNGP